MALEEITGTKQALDNVRVSNKILTTVTDKLKEYERERKLKIIKLTEEKEHLESRNQQLIEQIEEEKMNHK